MSTQNDIIKASKLAQQFILATQDELYDSANVSRSAVFHDSFYHGANSNEALDLACDIMSATFASSVGEIRTDAERDYDAGVLIRYTELFYEAARASFKEDELKAFLPHDIRHVAKALEEKGAKNFAAFCLS